MPGAAPRPLPKLGVPPRGPSPARLRLHSAAPPAPSCPLPVAGCPVPPGAPPVPSRCPGPAACPRAPPPGLSRVASPPRFSSQAALSQPLTRRSLSPPLAASPTAPPCAGPFPCPVGALRGPSLSLGLCCNGGGVPWLAAAPQPPPCRGVASRPGSPPGPVSGCPVLRGDRAVLGPARHGAGGGGLVPCPASGHAVRRGALPRGRDLARGTLVSPCTNVGRAGGHGRDGEAGGAGIPASPPLPCPEASWGRAR